MNIPQKIYIKVFGVFDIDGSFTPTKIEWTDGTRYDVDQFLRASLHMSACAGAPTMRYEVKIWGQVKYLFQETTTNRWFVESIH